MDNLEKARLHSKLASRMLDDIQHLKNDLQPESVILDTIEAAYGILQTIYIQTLREYKLAIDECEDDEDEETE